MSTTSRYFLSYSGIKLPLQLVEELPAESLRNRNTYFRADYDASGQMTCLEKLTYGEVEMRHDYVYDPAGKLIRATVFVGDEDETQTLEFA